MKQAVDCCVLLSQWDQAVALAQEHSIPQVQSLLFKYAAMLLEQQKTMEAVQLYRKVQHGQLYASVATPFKFKHG